MKAYNIQYSYNKCIEIFSTGNLPGMPQLSVARNHQSKTSCAFWVGGMMEPLSRQSDQGWRNLGIVELTRSV